MGTDASLQGGGNTIDKHAAVTGRGSIIAALDLNGSDDSVSIANSLIGFADSTAFSFSIWANFDSSTGPLWGRTSQDTSSIRKAGDTTISVQNADGTKIFTVPSLGTGVWHHILVTRTSGNSVRVFVDGSESSSGPQTLGNLIATQHIGRRNTSFFNGQLAWAKVFNSDESSNAAALYAEGVSSALLKMMLEQ